MPRLFNPVTVLKLALSFLLIATSLTSLAVPAQKPLVLANPAAIVDVWPVVTMLHDPEGKLTISEVLAASDRFSPPQSAYATLGLRKKVVWLNVPILVPGVNAGPTTAATAVGAETKTTEQWILDIDYTLLNRIDVYLATDGRVVQQALLGNAQPVARRPILSRSHAVPIELRPGMPYTLLLRVETVGAMILPITLSKLSAFHGRAIDEQILQGLLTSLGLCMLFYSLLQWGSLRESLYLKYSLQILGSLLFTIHFFGLGELYLWTDNMWFQRHMAGIGTIMAVCGTALFIEDVLGPDMSRRLRRAMKFLVIVLALVAVAHAIDWMDIQAVSVVMGTIGLLPALMGVPGAFARMQRRDSVGAFFLLAWIIYFFGRAVAFGIVTGQLGVNFWTLHLFQFGAAIDMLIFMRIAILRSSAVHLAAERATQEHATLHSLAHTDPLTALLNRRGLNTTLTAALHNCEPDKLLAVYMLDLDGFKLVNDQFGHDVGDELLEIVASRLRATVRAGDGIARLGGDEFVVLAGGLQSDEQAIELGTKLVDAISRPFALSRHQCSVSVTIGYALAPPDGRDTETLLKQADAAMYAGKQSGRNCLRRGETGATQ